MLRKPELVEPPSKKGRTWSGPLHGLHGRSHATYSAVAAICKSVDENGLPAAYSRATQYRRRKTAAGAHTAYGPLTRPLSLPDGTIIGVQNPAAMLLECAARSSAFVDVLQAAIAENPMPWHIVLYTDGITPADTAIKHDLRHLEARGWV